MNGSLNLAGRIIRIYVYNFRAGLKLGSSKRWDVALELMTGEDKLDASALLEYFAPLLDYLHAKNMPEAELADFLENVYNPGLQVLSTAEVHAEWNYATNINKENADAVVRRLLRFNIRYY